ncbi:hypothetical protein [Magnetospirillum sp. 64-120]|uniref:hypothetical protein n=1 Tax=Magnetospirillum sp. 64-120 TaxID=1895778 RepID=UPI000925F823|nr:hypothetical protein [Magnetospirillum sp. 64-120]OJX83284.1 MAG: hypothetical protein BGO92_11170 [Magnetospirillum sp. 64-120]
MLSLLLLVSIVFACVFALAFFLASIFFRSPDPDVATPSKFFMVIAALFALYAVSAFIWRGHGERQELAEIAAKKEFSELVQSRCAAANRQYEDALLTRENYGSLSATQQARMGREWGADGNWVQDQVTQGRRALGDCEQRLMADKAAIYRSHGLSLEK